MALISAEEIRDATSMALSGRSVSPEDHLAYCVRLRQAATILVNKQAAAAPSEIKCEAIIRWCGAMLESGYGARFDSQVRPINHSAMFRTCGALGLLAPWRVLRGGVV